MQASEEIERDKFPPLLPDDTFTVGGYRIPPRKVIARIWLFSKTYAEAGKRSEEIEAERENPRFFYAQTTLELVCV